MNLHIDSTQPKYFLIRLGEHEIKHDLDRPQDQNILAGIDADLKLAGISKKEITSITVNPGPGSFTGTRVGVSVANALAFAMNLKINKQVPPVLPVYNQEPKITCPEKKAP